jgi:UDP-glucose 4-epimerase
MNSGKMKKIFVTGAAGFIGSNLVDKLLSQGLSVVGWDNLVTGQLEFLEEAKKQTQFRFVQGDNLDLPTLTKAMAGCDTVFHFAANADIRFGLQHPDKDLQQNTIATFHILEAMRANQIKRIIFSSTGAIYGEPTIFPTPEDKFFPTQTSLYGASKLASEGLIEAYCEGYQFEGYIFRFVSVLGERYTHGHVFDFYKQLLEHPDYLIVQGDGTQRKSYLYIQDCLAAMLHALSQKTATQSPHRVQIYNLGTNESCEVKQSIQWICQHLNLQPRLEFTGGKRGWIGDNPFVLLDIEKIMSIGWQPQLTIQQSIIKTMEWLAQNKWAMQRR